METKKKTSLFKGVKLFWHDLYITITYINLSILKTAEDGVNHILRVFTEGIYPLFLFLIQLFTTAKASL
jgi:hypothetical protein